MLPKLKFPPGYRWELAGNYQSQQESFASLPMVLIVAAALVFLLLGFQFRSLTLPLLIFLSQPISLASALVALWITGTPLNVSSFMGAILLDRAGREERHHPDRVHRPLLRAGLPLNEALVQAGRTRFRPILMTSLCTIFGLLPLGLRLRARGTDAAAAGHRRDRRPDRQHAVDAALDPRGIPGPPRPRRGGLTTARPVPTFTVQVGPRDQCS